MAGTVGKGALLLKDAHGKKSGSLLAFRKKKDVAVLRGSLLIALSPRDTPPGADGKTALNYGVHNEDITLYCSEEDIVPLTNYEFQLLSGISTLGARYDAFIRDNHEWGSSLREDEIVYVALPTKEALAITGCQAVVRWIGTLPGETGITFGIEIMEEKYRGSGSTNGIFQYRQIFICDDNCGMFVSLERLAPTPNFRPTITSTARPLKATLPYTVRSRLGLKADSEGKSQNTPGGRANTSQGRLAASTRSQGHKNSAHLDQNPIQVPMEEQTDQLINDPTEKMMRYIGNCRGIQGHQNSCYLDSTIFGLFALSDVFDGIFLYPSQSITTDQNRKRVANLLWKGIVNPLRKNGVVRFESVMKMRNALEELGKMEGITEKEKDPEEFLNMLFKHVLHTTPFISIRRPFGVEQEFFVQLFVEHDPNLRVPNVGHLLRKMFKEQHISFTRVPSKLLLQVPRFGREFQTYKRIVPELKLNIRELTDTYKKTCCLCGEESAISCKSCGPLSQQQFTHYCQRCSDCYHRHKNRVQHRRTATIATPADDPGLAELDLLSVICIETSHYVCFTRDPRGDEIQKKWIFFDSMADRKYDTYNIPRVTDCTRELNEWVYSDVRGRDKLFSTPPRELPELVRRFTQDIYMCVYIQPDVAMYGDGDGDDSSSVRESTAVSLEESKDDIIEGLKQEMAEMEEQNQQQIYIMQRKLEATERETSLLRFTKLQIPDQNQDSWNVQRRDVVIQEEIGNGAWGVVWKGEFRGNVVAVKQAHKNLLYKPFIDQLKREIRIMAHVQHPNLVRLIAAVVDAGVERGTDSPLLVLEFLDIDLRSAYERKIVDFQKDALLSIFREVAYALHYLHEHQEPIIHRDVSAPNVLLQQIHPGVWKAKLSDFGSANVAKNCKTAAPGAIVYAAPETFPPSNLDDPLPKQTTKIDVYSYGYLLAEAVAKEIPSPENRRAILLRIKSEWEQVHDIIAACVESQPDNRLSMTQVLEKLNMLPSQ